MPVARTVGWACGPTGISGALHTSGAGALYMLWLCGRALHRGHVDARADRRRDDRGEDPAKLVRLERAPHEHRIDVLGVNADMSKRRRRRPRRSHPCAQAERPQRRGG